MQTFWEVTKVRINSITAFNNKIKHPAFKSKMVNNHLYSDEVYADAFAHKNRGEVNYEEFFPRFKLWEIIFTTRCEKYAATVEECRKDILLEEFKQQKKRTKEIKKLKEEQEALEAERRRAEEEAARQKEEIERKSLQAEQDCLIKSCCLLSEEQKAEIIDTLISPIRNVDNNNGYETIPNGILIIGSNKKIRKQINDLIVIDVLKGFQDNIYFIIKNVTNDEIFVRDLCELKEKAKNIYENSKKRTILFMDDFDCFAPGCESEKYSQSKNGFLKNYFLDCADNGCLIIASARSKKNIDAPFLINKKRFGLVIELKDA